MTSTTEGTLEISLRQYCGTARFEDRTYQLRERRAETISIRDEHGGLIGETRLRRGLIKRRDTLCLGEDSEALVIEDSWLNQRLLYREERIPLMLWPEFDARVFEFDGMRMEHRDFESMVRLHAPSVPQEPVIAFLAFFLCMSFNRTRREG